MMQVRLKRDFYDGEVFHSCRNRHGAFAPTEIDREAVDLPRDAMIEEGGGWVYARPGAALASGLPELTEPKTFAGETPVAKPKTKAKAAAPAASV